MVISMLCLSTKLLIIIVVGLPEGVLVICIRSLVALFLSVTFNACICKY